MEAQMEELRAEGVKMAQELADAEDRLKNLEAEAADLLHLKTPPPPPALNGNEALMDAVRTLMVSLHRLDIPPQIREAATAVQQQLPDEPLSEDYTGDASEEETGPEAAKRALEVQEVMTEFDMMDDEDDVALIAMARRLKRARRAGPY